MRYQFVLFSLLVSNILCTQEIPTEALSDSIIKNKSFSGKILDDITKEPIPYANIIIVEKEVYRIADEDGSFELPELHTLGKSNISISSMGYTTVNFVADVLKEIVFLEPSLTELEEVQITGYRTPEAVLKLAIKNIKINHPVEPYNAQRYSHIIRNKDDKNLLDLEVITTEYEHGYQHSFVSTRRVEQIKWNVGKENKKINRTSPLIGGRENAIQYATIFSKRKSQKFKLQFEKSNKEEDFGRYIISFKTDRNNWKFTNRTYPTIYSGKLFIDQVSFAILKVEQTWETTLNREEIKQYLTKGPNKHKNASRIKIKQEEISIYGNIPNNKYCTVRQFYRSHHETIFKDGTRSQGVFDAKSYFYNHELENPEEIDFDYDRPKLTLLRRVAYNKVFWDDFFKKHADIKNRS